MAYYTSRVDDEGNEIERRLSARSTTSTIPSGTSRLISASSHESHSMNDHQIRYLNPAAFIEKSGGDRIDACSYDEAMHLMNMSETQSNHSNIVPPLDLQSEDSCPTHRGYTFSYRKHVVPSNIVDPKEAYKTWLSAKRKVKSDEAAKRKKIEDEKRKIEEERKEKAREEYERWCERKAARNAAAAAAAAAAHAAAVEKERKAAKVKKAAAEENEITDQEAQERLIKWERQKRLQEERKRLMKRQEEEAQKQLEEQRRQMAADAWNRWSANAAKKPKPVPLNRGFFTLRGTVSDIYVNPNEWQSIVPETSK